MLTVYFSRGTNLTKVTHSVWRFKSCWNKHHIGIGSIKLGSKFKSISPTSKYDHYKSFYNIFTVISNFLSYFIIISRKTIALDRLGNTYILYRYLKYFAAQSLNWKKVKIDFFFIVLNVSTLDGCLHLVIKPRKTKNIWNLWNTITINNIIIINNERKLKEHIMLF